MRSTRTPGAMSSAARDDRPRRDASAPTAMTAVIPVLPSRESSGRDHREDIIADEASVREMAAASPLTVPELGYSLTRHQRANGTDGADLPESRSSHPPRRRRQRAEPRHARPPPREEVIPGAHGLRWRERPRSHRGPADRPHPARHRDAGALGPGRAPRGAQDPHRPAAADPDGHRSHGQRGHGGGTGGGGKRLRRQAARFSRRARARGNAASAASLY